MGLKFNNTSVEKVMLDGIEATKVIYDGTTFRKIAFNIPTNNLLVCDRKGDSFITIANPATIDLGNWHITSTDYAYGQINFKLHWRSSNAWSVAQSAIINSTTSQSASCTYDTSGIDGQSSNIDNAKIDATVIAYEPVVSLISARTYQFSSPTTGNFVNSSQPLRYIFSAACNWYDGWGDQDKTLTDISIIYNQAGLNIVPDGKTINKGTLSGGVDYYRFEVTFGYRLQKYSDGNWIDVSDDFFPNSLHYNQDATGTSSDNMPKWEEL